jgi:hypothetical protein
MPIGMLGRDPHQIIGAAVLGCFGKPAHNRSKYRFLAMHHAPTRCRGNSNSFYDQVDVGRPDIFEGNGDQTPPSGRSILAVECKRGTQRDGRVTPTNGFLQRA